MSEEKKNKPDEPQRGDESLHLPKIDETKIKKFNDEVIKPNN